MSNATTSDPYVWTVGDRMRKAREAAGLKPSEMAARLGDIHRNNIPRWESGKREPLMRRGVDLRTVQSLLRHQSLATSEAYLARPELERMRAAVAA